MRRICYIIMLFLCFALQGCEKADYQENETVTYVNSSESRESEDTPKTKIAETKETDKMDAYYGCYDAYHDVLSEEAYDEDFIWEKEVTDRTTGKKYTIRYAEAFLPEEAERNYGIYYDGRIYVYDEDTYLVSVTHSEIILQSESIEWKDGDEDTEQMIVIHYTGGNSGYYLSGLIVPDYEE